MLLFASVMLMGIACKKESIDNTLNINNLEKLIGTWIQIEEYEQYNGEEYDYSEFLDSCNTEEVTFRQNGEFKWVVIDECEIYEIEEGNYIVEGNKLKIEDPDFDEEEDKYEILLWKVENEILTIDTGEDDYYRMIMKYKRK